MFFYLILLLFIFISCSEQVDNKNNIKGIDVFDTLLIDINFYIDNSRSMDGYVRNRTEFEQSLYSYLLGLRESLITQEINIFLINRNIYQFEGDIHNFMDILEPYSYYWNVGNRRTTDFFRILRNILDNADSNDVSIFVTDGVFSLGNNTDDYLRTLSSDIFNSLITYFRNYPNSAVLLYMLESRFNGRYYNNFDQPIYINELRPFYILTIGNYKLIKRLMDRVPPSSIQGSGVLNLFLISPFINVNYSIVPSSGNFDIDINNPKSTIRNLRRDNEGYYRFAVDVDFSKLYLPNDYLLDTSNYQINGNYEINIITLPNNNYGFTHRLFLSSRDLNQSEVVIYLKRKMLPWIDSINTEDGTYPMIRRTYSLRPQIDGIIRTFNSINEYYTTIKIKIN